MYRIGYLAPNSAATASHFTEPFRQGLRELGWVEGQNIVIEYRFAEGHFDRLPDLAAGVSRRQLPNITLQRTGGSRCSPRPLSGCVRRTRGRVASLTSYILASILTK